VGGYCGGMLYRWWLIPHHGGGSGGMRVFPCFITGWPPPVRLSGQAVMAGKCNTLPIFRGRLYHLRQLWGGVRFARWKDENPGGQSTPRRGGVLAGEAGSRPARKKTQTRTFAIFSTLRPPATAGGYPSPFEPLMKGLRPERSVAE
jgi:hypothetical protein